MGFEPEDKLEYINSGKKYSKNLFFPFLSKNTVDGFMPLSFLENDRNLKFVIF
jgi:hypothetical protein